MRLRSQIGLHIAALGARFISDFFHAIAAFADFADAEIKMWPLTERPGLSRRSKEILDELIKRDDPSIPQRCGRMQWLTGIAHRPLPSPSDAQYDAIGQAGLPVHCEIG